MRERERARDWARTKRRASVDAMPPSDRVYEPSKQWDVVPWSQWSQTYYELRDGKLYLCHNDNKDQHYSEDEEMPTSIADEIRAHIAARRKNVSRSSPRR